MGNDTVRSIGYPVEVVQAIAPVTLSGTTPVLSSAIDLTGAASPTHNRKTILVIGAINAATNGATMSVTESATSGGTYAAPAAGNLIDSGAVADATAGVQTIQYRRNPAKPFFKVTYTGDNAATNGKVSAIVVFGGLG